MVKNTDFRMVTKNEDGTYNIYAYHRGYPDTVVKSGLIKEDLVEIMTRHREERWVNYVNAVVDGTSLYIDMKPGYDTCYQLWRVLNENMEFDSAFGDYNNFRAEGRFKDNVIFRINMKHVSESDKCRFEYKFIVADGLGRTVEVHNDFYLSLRREVNEVANAIIREMLEAHDVTVKYFNRIVGSSHDIECSTSGLTTRTSVKITKADR